MNGELQAETRDFECDLIGDVVQGTVTKYLDGMVNPNDPSFKGVRYTVATKVNGIRYKFTMFYEAGNWNSRLLSVYSDESTGRLASLDTFVMTAKTVEVLFENAMYTLHVYQPNRLDEDEPPLSLFDKTNN